MSPEDKKNQEDKIRQYIEAISSSLEIDFVSGKTHLILIVTDRGESDNTNCRLENSNKLVKCRNGEAFYSGYPYDQASDSYVVSCVEYLYLGHVPFAFMLKMPTTGGWKVSIPLPKSVLDNCLSPVQKSSIASTREKYPSDRYDIDIMQMSGCDN